MAWGAVASDKLRNDGQKDVATRRIGLLIFLSIIYIVLNMLAYLLFNQILGITLPNYIATLMIVVVAISTVGVLYSVFVLANYSTKRRNK